MMVRVKLFAVARQRVGKDELEIEVSSAAPTVADLRAEVKERYPALAEVLPYIRVAVNSEYASDATVLPKAAEVALIPPVSGG